METLKKLRLSIWKKLVDQYYGLSYRSDGVSDFTFPPSAEFINYLVSSFSESTIEGFENGPTFSSYQVSYHNGNVYGHAIYKTTVTTYPRFSSFKTMEEYKRSFKK
jgi:hypothetical protein